MPYYVTNSLNWPSVTISSYTDVPQYYVNERRSHSETVAKQAAETAKKALELQAEAREKAMLAGPRLPLEPCPHCGGETGCTTHGCME